MSTYIDIVVVDTQFGKRIFKAPAWSYLKPEDKVTVNTRAGIVPGTVLNCNTMDEESSDYTFLISASHATLPLKRVVSKITETLFIYPEDSVEQEEESNDEE